MRFSAAVMMALLALLFSSTARGQSAPVHGTDSPRAARIKSDLGAILSGPEYRRLHATPTPIERIGSWIGDLMDRFFTWLRRLFRPQAAEEPMGSSVVVLYIVVVALVIGMAVLIALLVRRALERDDGASRRKKAPETSVESVVEDPLGTDPDRWVTAARRYAEAGDFRRAYRAVFLALLMRLDRAGALRYDPARTNGDYLRALRGRSDLLSLFRPLAYEFDARWYGGKTVAETDYHRCLAAYESIRPAS